MKKAKKRRVQHIRFALERSLNYTRISSIEGFREQVKQRAYFSQVGEATIL